MAEIQADILSKAQQFLYLVKEQGITINQAFLYGSYATGKARLDSDIDVAIVSSSFTNDFVENYVTLAKVRAKVDYRIEPKAFRPEEFSDDHPLAWEIKQHGIPL